MSRTTMSQIVGSYPLQRVHLQRLGYSILLHSLLRVEWETLSNLVKGNEGSRIESAS